jgi:integrase
VGAYKAKQRNGSIMWRYRRKGVKLPNGSIIEISGTPNVNTKQAALDAEAAHYARVMGFIAPAPEPEPAPKKPEPSGPTLREAMAVHVAKMRKDECSDVSISTLESELTRHCAAYLDRPIKELSGARLSQLHDDIKASVRKKAGSNPLNKKGAPTANRTIMHVSACWNSLNRKLEGALGVWNPARAVDRDHLKPKRVRLANEELPDYAARVATMPNPIQRDGLMFALYTGLRNEDVRTARLDEVDWKASTLRLLDPKGGEDRAFTIPLSPTALAILERRRKSNSRDLGKPDRLRADGGYAFPTINREGKPAPISDLRWQKHHGEDGHERFPAEDVHTLRRTFLSVAQEEGVSKLDRQVLANHAFGNDGVNEIYVSQHIDHLRECARRIDAGITRRIKGKVENQEQAEDVG